MRCVEAITGTGRHSARLMAGARCLADPLALGLALGLALAAAGCSNRISGQDCAGFEDCPAGHWCVDQLCQYPCATARDCPDSVQACAFEGRSFGLCVAVDNPSCSADSQCSGLPGFEAPGPCQVPGSLGCAGGQCGWLYKPERALCDDDDPCTLEDHCGADHRCRGSVLPDCIAAPRGPGERCYEADDCASDLHCERGVCCAAGARCCLFDADCGRCERCDAASGACVPQGPDQDLRDECHERVGSCEAELCDGTRPACAVKPAGSACAPCRSCDADGACATPTMDHEQCPTCQHCLDGQCVHATAGSDPKDECAALTCAQLVAGWSGDSCRAFATGGALNGGCDGEGRCAGPALACSGLGASLASCPDSACLGPCPTGAPASAHDSPAEVCYTSGQHGCPSFEVCGPGGACQLGPVDQDCYTHWLAGATVSGVYHVDPDGPGGAPGLDVWCDMATDTPYGGGWTLVANRIPYADNLGMPDLDAPHGSYDGDDRSLDFNLDVRPFYPNAGQVLFATRFAGQRCGGQEIACYDNILTVDLPQRTDKAYAIDCNAPSSPRSAFKHKGGSGVGASQTAYLCADSLGWGACGSGQVCHYGSHGLEYASDGSWSWNYSTEIHVPSTRSGYRAHASCRTCNGGTSYCCNNDQNADEVFTVWLRGGVTPAPRQPLGAHCSSADDCLSGHCADGFCCDQACADTCQACNLSGSEGRCRLAPAGTDPGHDCSSIGCTNWLAGWDPSGRHCLRYAGPTPLDGMCDGRGACVTDPTVACSGAGAATVSCADAGCARACQAGAFYTSADTLAEACWLDGLRHDCGLPSARCDASAACVDCNECSAGASECLDYGGSGGVQRSCVLAPDGCLRWQLSSYCAAACGCSGGPTSFRDCTELLAALPGAPTGPYPLDPDGPGPQPPQTLFCDMDLRGGGWTLVANRIPFADALGMPPLEEAHGAYDWATRSTDFNLDLDLFYGRAAKLMIATTFRARCGAAGLGCYANVLELDLPATAAKAYSPACTRSSSSYHAFKVRGGSGAGAAHTAYLCQDALGWGDCNDLVCHIGSHGYSYANDSSWSYNLPVEIHVPSTASAYRGHASCRHCNGGASYCCGNDQNADEVFTLWVRTGVGEALVAQGGACQVDADCANRACVDGYCCDSTCTGTCMTCAAPGQEGQCVPVPPDTDPAGECGALDCTRYVYGWDGSGACLAYAGPTALNGTCNGAGACHGPTAACTAPGTPLVSCDLGCARACTPGAPASSHDAYAETCWADWAQHGCSGGSYCDLHGACTGCDQCNPGMSRCVDIAGSPHAYQTCVQSSIGCWRWQTQDYCSAGCGCSGGPRTFGSCRALQAYCGSLPDGLYFLDSDGSGGRAPLPVYCDMTTAGGGWMVMAWLRDSAHWSWPIFTDLGVVGDLATGFASGNSLRSLPGTVSEKLIVYRHLVERPSSGLPYADLGSQWMRSYRDDPVVIGAVNGSSGWSHYRDSFGAAYDSISNACTHGCSTYRTWGMFADCSGPHCWHGTQGGDYGCRDGNNICWYSRGGGCNVGDLRCAYLRDPDEGVVFAIR